MNNPNCFAFVRFEFNKHAYRAIQSLNGICLNGRRISVSEAKYGRCSTDERLDSKQNTKQIMENYKNSGDEKQFGRRSFKSALLGEKNGAKKLGRMMFLRLVWLK
ncbi:hypothetical protein PIB30_092991, partial [Stylosanthes scabra]|nr:hypothetical protein [Stylosanthes scabra]